MTEALSRRLKQARFASPRQEALLSLAVAAGAFNDMADAVCEKYGLTRPQYNVLRILRGVYPEGHPRCDIAVRMIERAPDVTRLVDRLQTQGLVRRARGTRDQRQAVTRITPKGLKLLDTIQPDLDSATDRLLRDLTDKDCHELARLCGIIFDRPILAPPPESNK